MELSFLTPFAGCFAVAALLPLLVHRSRERRAAAVRAALGLGRPPRRARPPLAAALAFVPLLLGLAAAQPVVERSRTRPERTDAEILLALDTSRSMLASQSPRSTTRLERARDAALELQRALPDVPIGLASFGERMLLHALPTTDARVLGGVLGDSLGIERPLPLPQQSFARQGTTLDALAAATTASYFAPSARRRLIVVFTDGETRRVGRSLVRAFDRRRRVDTLIVRFWSPDERVYAAGVAEPGYRPDRASDALLAHASSVIGARVFGEDELDDLRLAAERVLGSGPTRPRSFEHERAALMPYVTLAALLPLAFVLRRRNLYPWASVRSCRRSPSTERAITSLWISLVPS